MQIIDLTKSKINVKPLQYEYYIYVLENSNGFIKIGRSHNIKQRAKSLSGSNTGGNKILRVAISEPTWIYTLETTAHEYFWKNRIKNTEWFQGITFEEAVNVIDGFFQNLSYKSCNETRKMMTERQLKYEEKEN